MGLYQSWPLAPLLSPPACTPHVRSRRHCFITQKCRKSCCTVRRQHPHLEIKPHAIYPMREHFVVVSHASKSIIASAYQVLWFPPRPEYATPCASVADLRVDRNVGVMPDVCVKRQRVKHRRQQGRRQMPMMRGTRTSIQRVGAMRNHRAHVYSRPLDRGIWFLLQS